MVSLREKFRECFDRGYTSFCPSGYSTIVNIGEVKVSGKGLEDTRLLWSDEGRVCLEVAKDDPTLSEYESLFIAMQNRLPMDRLFGEYI